MSHHDGTAIKSVKPDTIIGVRTAMCLIFLVAILFSSNTEARTENAMPVIEDNIIHSASNPSLQIKLDPSMQFVGRHPVTIRDVAAGERIVFAQAEGKTLKRVFIAQFEAFHPHINKTYNYNLNGKPVVAGYPWRSNAFGFDMALSKANNPEGEAAGTANLLESMGFSVPQHWLMWRSLTVTDQARKSELILFYVEFGKDHNLTIDDIYQNNAETDVWLALQKEIAVRANNSFSLAPYSNPSEANQPNWSSIPVS